MINNRPTTVVTRSYKWYQQSVVISVRVYINFDKIKPQSQPKNITKNTPKKKNHCFTWKVTSHNKGQSHLWQCSVLWQNTRIRERKAWGLERSDQVTETIPLRNMKIMPYTHTKSRIWKDKENIAPREATSLVGGEDSTLEIKLQTTVLIQNCIKHTVIILRRI